MKLDPDTLADHVKMHKMQPHCSACGEFLEDDFALHNHLSHYEVSWANYDWGCRECSVKFTDQDSLRRHTKEVHRKCFAMQYSECPETVDTVREFVHHVREHKPSLKYYCQYCNFKYNEANQIILHILKHQHNQCETCGESFISPSALKSHVDVYIKPNARTPKQKITVCV
ncbi:zinc finger X-chromosomal protein-like isoform X2 [Choristoneura fumiferana]